MEFMWLALVNVVLWNPWLMHEFGLNFAGYRLNWDGVDVFLNFHVTPAVS